VLWDQDNFPGDFHDIACNVAGVDIEHGPINDTGLFPAGNMAATIIDPDGRFSRYRPDGTLVTWQIGKRIGVVLDDGDPDSDHAGWTWLYYGRITRWSQTNENTIEIESFNMPNEMGPVGKFTAGANGDTPAARLGAIRLKVPAADILTRFDTGTVALTAQESNHSPYEEMQIVALSDGGLLFPDVDDAMVYRDRNWLAGRSDQSRIWFFADNVCEPSVDVNVWDAVLTSTDETVRTEVRLTNVAGLNSHAEFIVNPYSFDQVLTHSQPDQWTLQAEGDILAQVLHDRYSIDHANLEEFQLYVHDHAQNLWPVAIDTRINDRFIFTHTYPQPGAPRGRFQLGAVVTLIRHSISASQWVMTIGSFSYTLPFATVAVAGISGHFLDNHGAVALMPATRVGLSAIVPETPVWTDGEHVVLGDGTEWYHDATACDPATGWVDEFTGGLSSEWVLGPYTTPAGALNEDVFLGIATGTAVLTPRYAAASFPHPIVSMIRPSSAGDQTIEVEIDAGIWDQETGDPVFYSWWLELNNMVDPVTGARRNGSFIYDHNDSELTCWVGSYDETGGVTSGSPLMFFHWPTGANMRVRHDAYLDGRQVLWINDTAVVDFTETTTIAYGTDQGFMSQWTSADAGGDSPIILRSEGGPIGGGGTCWLPGRAPK
jgi:hypothetical protein